MRWEKGAQTPDVVDRRGAEPPPREPMFPESLVRSIIESRTSRMTSGFLVGAACIGVIAFATGLHVGAAGRHDPDRRAS
ncbi:MAG TPA: hypothetical protein VNZ44_12075, partial [Pyrinomonadaceae bacterium]|nr:hypothetical protein [Pyrinomonadaceae bacterium]